MINGNLIYDKDKRLVPDNSRLFRVEKIGQINDNYYAKEAPDWVEFHYTEFNLASVIWMVLICTYRDDDIATNIDISVKFNDVLCRDVIEYRILYDFATGKREYYYILPYNDRIQIVSSCKKDTPLTKCNAKYIDLPFSTTSGELREILEGTKKEFFKSFPTFIRNVEAYNDINFEFIED